MFTKNDKSVLKFNTRQGTSLISYNSSSSHTKFIGPTIKQVIKSSKDQFDLEGKVAITYLATEIESHVTNHVEAAERGEQQIFFLKIT